jgi:MoxR-like ATPase
LSGFPFELLVPGRRAPERRELLATRPIPPTLGSLEEAAPFYQPDPELTDAINVSLAVGAPLLLTGEPGTGKTQVAYYLAWHFDIPLFPQVVRSTTTAEDLLYRFDAVAYLHAAHDPALAGQEVMRERFIQKGPLWKAYEAGGPAVVLLDEIDKAPRDFPNDLLDVLDQHTFAVPELDATVSRGKMPAPIVVITSNSERRLPEPFLRRSIFHHIEFTENLVRRAVAARGSDFPNLSPAVQEAAVERFLELRGRDLRKKPATAELLVWLTVLSARSGVSVDTLRGPVATLPALSALIKDRDDLALLG